MPKERFLGPQFGLLVPYEGLLDPLCRLWYHMRDSLAMWIPGACPSIIMCGPSEAILGASDIIYEGFLEPYEELLASYEGFLLLGEIFGVLIPYEASPEP